MVLNYNNPVETISCLKSLSAVSLPGYELKIVLVDNGSDKECVDTLRALTDPDLYFLETGKNLGYAGGNNAGIRFAKERKADYIIVLNNDVIVNEFSFAGCLKALQENASTGIAAPAILNVDGTVQSLGANIDFLRIKTKLIGYKEEYIPSTEIVSCDYVGGACMVFRSDLIDQIGYLPEYYFLFWEEAEWCIRAKKKGYNCCCVTSSSVVHKSSATIKAFQGLQSYFMERNRVVFSKQSNNTFMFILSLLFLVTRAIYRGVFFDKKNFGLLKYYFDGLTNRIDRKNFPLIG